MGDATTAAAWNLVDLMSSQAQLQREDVLLAIKPVVDFDHAALVRAPPIGPAQFFKRGNWLERFRRHDLQYRADVAPVIAHARANQLVAIDTRVLSTATRRKLALYSDIVRPQRIRSMGFVLLPRRGTHATLMLQRTGTRQYSDRDVKALQRLAPLLALADRMIENPPSFSMLSPREHEVAEYARLGYRNTDIALACGCSANTVHNHLKSIFRKLEISSRVELTAMAQRFGA